MKSGRIYMIGPSFKTQGGISSVLAIYKSQLADSMNMGFIASYSGHKRIYDLCLFIAALVRVFTICLAEKGTIFHIHISTGGSYIRKSLIAKLCMLFGRRVILHIHGADYDQYIEQAGRFLRKDIISLLNRADVLIVLSESWRDYFAGFVNKDRIRVVYNPCAVIEREYERRNNSSANILFTGRMGERKGTYDLMEAASRLKHLEFVLTLYGDGDVENIRSLVKEKGLEGKVVVNGWIHHAMIYPLYQKADFLVLPSYAEGMPMSVLEAMGAGLPVVSTFAGGIPEMITDGVSGFLIKPGDIAGLAEKMELLILNPRLRENMGRSALDKAKSRFSVEASRDMLGRIYSKLNSAV